MKLPQFPPAYGRSIGRQLCMGSERDSLQQWLHSWCDLEIPCLCRVAATQLEVPWERINLILYVQPVLLSSSELHGMAVCDAEVPADSQVDPRRL